MDENQFNLLIQELQIIKIEIVTKLEEIRSGIQDTARHDWKETFLEGDFPVKEAECPHYCSPTCHPAQTGPKWVYGCLHPAWPQNQVGDFCPIVNCGGILKNCEIPNKRIEPTGKYETL